MPPVNNYIFSLLYVNEREEQRLIQSFAFRALDFAVTSNQFLKIIVWSTTIFSKILCLIFFIITKLTSEFGKSQN